MHASMFGALYSRVLSFPSIGWPNRSPHDGRQDRGSFKFRMSFQSSHVQQDPSEGATKACSVRLLFAEVWPRANIVLERYNARYEGTRHYVPCFVVGLCPWVDWADRSRVLVDSEVDERALCELPTVGAKLIT